MGNCEKINNIISKPTIFKPKYKPLVCNYQILGMRQKGTLKINDKSLEMVFEIGLKLLKGDLPMNVRKVTAKMAHYKKATKKEKVLDFLQELTGFNRTYLARRLQIFSFKKVEKIRGLRSSYVNELEKRKLERQYQELDLYQLKQEINSLVNKLYRLAKRKTLRK